MRHEVTIGGKWMLVEAQWIGNQLWVHLNGRTFPYESEAQKRERRGSGGTGHAGDLLAPMPGKITKVLASSGAEVQKGEAVVVMEAMKMEYTLKSAGAGTIEAIHCKVGDQVTLGKVLVKIKPQA